MEKKNVVPVPPVGDSLITEAELNGMVAEFYEESEFALSTIQISHPIAKFMVATGEVFDSFDGVIIDTHLTNAYWEGDSTGNNSPTCVSYDGIKPSSDSSKKQCSACARCQLNQFGSDTKGGGKACKNMRRIAVLVFRDGRLVPCQLTLPPSSLKDWERGYMDKLHLTTVQIAGKSVAATPWLVVSKFSLTPKVNGSQKYSTVNIDITGVIPEDYFHYIKNQREKAKEFRTRKFDADVEYPMSGTASQDDLPSSNSDNPKSPDEA